MKKQTSILLAALVATTLHAAAQGSLTPPPGAPAPVMKTLDQIEARTPVNQTTCPGNVSTVYVISQPGSYYLTSNLATESFASGIAINADDVTLDLNGFSIIRLTGTGGDAINIGSSKGIRIFNGTIRGGTTQSGGVFTPAGWNNGILSTQPAATTLQISDIIVRGDPEQGHWMWVVQWQSGRAMPSRYLRRDGHHRELGGRLCGSQYVR